MSATSRYFADFELIAAYNSVCDAKLASANSFLAVIKQKRKISKIPRACAKFVQRV